MSADEATARQGGSHWAIAAGTAAKAMSKPSAEPASRPRSAAFTSIVIVPRSLGFFRAADLRQQMRRGYGVAWRRRPRGAGANADEPINFA